MALSKCAECGNIVSDQAPFCPHCGAPTGAVPPPPSTTSPKIPAPGPNNSDTIPMGRNQSYPSVSPLSGNGNHYPTGQQFYYDKPKGTNPWKYIAIVAILLLVCGIAAVILLQNDNSSPASAPLSTTTPQDTTVTVATPVEPIAEKDLKKGAAAETPAVEVETAAPNYETTNSPSDHAYELNDDGSRSYKINAYVGKYPVIMEFMITSDNKVYGRYAYKSSLRKYGDKQSSWIDLEGEIYGGSISMTASTDKNGEIEKWDVVLSGSGSHPTLRGIMVSLRDGKTFDIH